MMQSNKRSVFETGVATVITGLAAVFMNFAILDRLWTLPPTLAASFQMALLYGSVSWGLKYLIRRWFNVRD
jgi:hypothetical protein